MKILITAIFALSMLLPGLWEARASDLGDHAGTSTPILSKGATTLETRTDRTIVRARITTYEAGTKEAVAKAYRAIGFSNVRLVQELRIQMGNRQVFVPLSTFCDLANLREGKLSRMAKRGWVLILEGGDASESYTVRIEFDAKSVRRRIVTSALTPDRPSQDTRYYTGVIGE